MTSKMIRHLLYYTLLAIVGVVRRSKCEIIEVPLKIERNEYLEEYLLLDQNKYHAEFEEFDDTTMIEIDLIDNQKHPKPHVKPRVLYQVGVSHFLTLTSICRYPPNYISYVYYY